MKPHWPIKPKQIALLNVAISQLGLDREDLKARFGVKSTKDLTNAQFDELMEHLKASGFVYRPKDGGRGRPPASMRGQQKAKQVHLAAIECALNALGRPWAYAEGIARQMFKVGKLEWLTPERLHKVQVALIYEERRQAGTPAPPQAGEPVERKPETLEKRRQQARGENVEPQP